MSYLTICNENYSYVANPEKVLEQLLSNGEEIPEIKQGKIVAGDHVELDVLNLKKRPRGK